MCITPVSFSCVPEFPRDGFTLCRDQSSWSRVWDMSRRSLRLERAVPLLPSTHACVGWWDCTRVPERGAVYGGNNTIGSIFVRAGPSHSRRGAWNEGGPRKRDSRCSVLLVFLPFLLAGRALEGSVMLNLEMCRRVGFAMSRPPLDSFRAWFLKSVVNCHGAGTRWGF